MGKVIILVLARVAKGSKSYWEPQDSFKGKWYWRDLMVEYTLIRKTGGGKMFQAEGRTYGKSWEHDRVWPNINNASRSIVLKMSQEWELGAR